MKELLGAASNIYYSLDVDAQTFQPGIEVVIMLSEPNYVLKGKKLQRSREKVETFRFSASVGGVGILLKSLVEALEEIKKQKEVISAKEAAEAATPAPDEGGGE